MRRLSRSQIAGGLLTVAVAAAVAGGLLLLDSPAMERAERIDSQRVADLAAIVRAVDVYWTRHGRLPATLSELDSEPGVNFRSNDAAAGVAYEYRALEAEAFDLCGTFERESPQDDGIWAHGAGRQCFRRTARTLK